MSEKKKKKSSSEINQHTDHEFDSENMVSFVPGSSIIDIGELRRAQEIDAILEEDEEVQPENDLDQEARLLRAELDQDPEMKKDVLADFEETTSDEELKNLASKIDEQGQTDLKHYQALAEEVSEEMKTMNHQFIEEDKLLESEIAKEIEKDHAIEAAANLQNSLNELSESDEDEEMSEEDTALKAALPQVDEEGNIDLDDLQSCIEALLFYSDRPVSLKKLKEMLEMPDVDNAPIRDAIELLKQEFSKRAHGFEIAEIAGGYQLRTKASTAPLLRKLAKVQIQRLSRGAMETLTIVAYKQPCTKDDIDIVRGVDSSHFMRTLLDRDLIEVTGRSEAAGRPMIYATTNKFLEVFGLMDLTGMPPLHEIEAMVPQMAAAEEGAEDPRVIQMRKLVHQMKTESNHLDYNAREDENILQEIRDRVKSIDISTPYLERQKQLAAEGITGEEAEELLAKEFGFASQSASTEETQPHLMDSVTPAEQELHHSDHEDESDASNSELS